MGSSFIVNSVSDIGLNFQGGVPSPVLVAELTSIFNLQLSPIDTILPMSFDGAVNSPSDPVMVDTAGLITFNDKGLYLVELTGVLQSPASFGVSTVVMANFQYNTSDQPAKKLGVLREVGGFQVGGGYPFKFLLDADAGDTVLFQIWADSAISAGTNALFEPVTSVAMAGVVTPAYRLEINQFYQKFD